jgi:hypothetical protein
MKRSSFLKILGISAVSVTTGIELLKGADKKPDITNKKDDSICMGTEVKYSGEDMYDALKKLFEEVEANAVDYLEKNRI